MTNKIFLWCIDSGWGSNSKIGYALAEDGTALGSHLSSSLIFSKYDMGLTQPSCPKHEAYRAYYPDGYELVWVDDIDNNVDFNQAYDEYKRKAEVVKS
ncbi:MAG: hypothetical protein KDK05_03865 [Candidatus Competibacteraceae bacterium]|nr:hypothetical protein [Candidatus Competibacteraceae bacterium]